MWKFEDVFDLEDVELSNDRIRLKSGKLPPNEIGGREFSALDYDTVVDHVKRNYDGVLMPNGAAKGVSAHKNGKTLDVSVFGNDEVEIRFKMDIEGIDNPEPYVEEVADQIVVELLNREEKLHRAVNTYIENLEGYEEPLDKLESEIEMFDGPENLVSSYFDSCRPNDLLMTYAAQFEMLPHQKASEERSGMNGRMPLTDSLEDETLQARNSKYLRRYVSEVIESGMKRYGESDKLKEYWLEITG